MKNSTVNKPISQAFVTRYNIQDTPLFALALRNHGKKKIETQIEIRSYASPGKVIAFSKCYAAHKTSVNKIQAEMDKFLGSDKFAKLCEQFDVLRSV